MEDTLFVLARDQFLASLPPKERGLLPGCVSAEQLLVEVGNMKHVKHAASRDSKASLINHIKSLADSLTPYFDCVGLMVAANTDIASPVWGAIRLILQMATTYVTFFKRVAGLMEDVARYFPKYRDVAQFLVGAKKEMPARLQQAIVEAYTTLLEVLQEMLSIFYKRDQRSRSKLVITFKAITVPFEARLGSLMKKLESCNTSFHDELRIFQFKETVEDASRGSKLESKVGDLGLEQERQSDKLTAILNATLGSSAQSHSQGEQLRSSLDDLKIGLASGYETLQQNHQDELRSRIRNWLSPPRFADSFQMAMPRGQRTSAEWFLSEHQYTTWKRASDGGKTLWVNGGPGAGKSVLAVTAVEDLLSFSNSVPNGPQVSYFFFRAGSPGLEHSSDAYRAILSQILHTHWMNQELVDCFSFAMSVSEGQLVASLFEVHDLLLLCTAHLPGHYVVLDAVDECMDPRVLVDDLFSLLAGTWTNLIVFSRPTVFSLLSRFSLANTLSVAKKNSKDIRAFADRNLSTLMAKKLLPRTIDKPDHPDKQTLMGRVLLGADGMFLWATLFFDYLFNSPVLSRQKRQEIILSIRKPERLDDMYARIVEKMDEQNFEEKELAANVFMWTLYSRVPLTTGELQLAINSSCEDEDEDEDDDHDEDEKEEEGEEADGDNAQDDEQGSYPDFTSRAIAVSGALVELTPAKSLGFIHLSARDYIAGLGKIPRGAATKCPEFLDITHIEAHCSLTTQCLAYVEEQRAHSIGPGDANKVFVVDRFPFAIYASTNWVYHLYEALTAMARSSTPPRPSTVSKVEKMLHDASSFAKDEKNFKSWMYLCYLFVQIDIRTAINLQNLQVVLPRVRGFFDEEGGDWLISYNTLIQLGATLQDISRDWGDQLSLNPSVIWEPEVAAFNPSLFLPENHSVKVNKLPPSRPGKAGASRKYSHKASVTTRDGRFLFILSIWPNQYYEDFSMTGSLVRDPIPDELCTGWTAMYDAWELRHSPVRVLSVAAKLAPEDVRAAIRDALSPHGVLGGLSLFMIPIPIAVCAGKPVFAVGSTIFSVDSPGDILRPRLRSVRLPPSSRDEDVIDKLRHGQTDDTSARFSKAQISPTGRYLLASGHLSTSSPTILRLTLFSIRTSPEVIAQCIAKADFQCLDESELDLGSQDYLQQSTQFHATLPLAIVTLECSVYVWDFTHGGGLHRCFWSDIDAPQEASFSSCGKFVLVRRCTSGILDVKSLADVLGDDRLSELSSDRDEPSAASTIFEIAEELRPAQGTALMVSLKHGGVVKSSLDGTVVEQGAVSQDQLMVSKSSTALHLRQSTREGEEDLQLLRLPAGASDNLTVFLPSPEDSYINIVSLGDTADSSKPIHYGKDDGDAVIRVKMDSIRAVKRKAFQAPQKSKFYPRIFLPLDNHVQRLPPQVRHYMFFPNGDDQAKFLYTHNSLWKRHVETGWNDFEWRQEFSEPQYADSDRYLWHSPVRSILQRLRREGSLAAVQRNLLNFEGYTQRHLSQTVRNMTVRDDLQSIVFYKFAGAAWFYRKMGRLAPGDMVPDGDMLGYLVALARRIARKKSRRGRNMIENGK